MNGWSSWFLWILPAFLGSVVFVRKPAGVESQDTSLPVFCSEQLGVDRWTARQDTSPTPIAQELGCHADKARQVLFWLPGRGEIPQEQLDARLALWRAGAAKKGAQRGRGGAPLFLLLLFVLGWRGRYVFKTEGFPSKQGEKQTEVFLLASL